MSDAYTLPDDLPAIFAMLPPKRRERVLAVLDRERAAERIREVYGPMLVRYKTQRAQDETAAMLQREGFRFVTARFVQSVMREQR